MKKRLSLFILMATMLLSCNKDDSNFIPSLPQKTQSGLNTFGFLLNSSIWTNYGQICFLFYGCQENLYGLFSSSNGDIIINADKVLYKNGSLNTVENIYIDISTNFRGQRTYSTLTNDTIAVGYWFSETGKPEKTYLLSQSNPTFTVKLTKIDTTFKIISGEFSGKLFRRLSDTSFATSLTDSIVISDGRFDIKFK